MAMTQKDMDRLIKAIGDQPPRQERSLAVPIPGHVIGEEDHLYIRSWTSLSDLELVVRGRIRFPDESVPFNALHHEPGPGDRLEDSDGLSLKDWKGGVLESVVVSFDPDVTTFPVKGQTWVQFGLTDGQFARDALDARNITANLGQDYIYPGNNPTWPPASIKSPLEGKGYPHAVTGTNPASGVDISESVPSNTRWDLLGVRITCAIGIAAFTPDLVIDDGTNEKARLSIAAALTANATEELTFAQNIQITTAVANRVNIPLPSPCFMMGGWRVRTVGITADDDYAAPELWVEEWLEP